MENLISLRSRNNYAGLHRRPSHIQGPLPSREATGDRGVCGRVLLEGVGRALGSRPPTPLAPTVTRIRKGENIRNPFV